MNDLLLPEAIRLRIMETVGAAPVESGGIIARKGCAVADFYFDTGAGAGFRLYKPCVFDVNARAAVWRGAGLEFAGFVHSHPASYIELSAMDIVAAQKTLFLNKLPFIYMGVVCETSLCFYLVSGFTVEPCDLRII